MNKSIKKSYIFLVLSLFLIPSLVLAADLTFSEDTTINLNIGGTSTDFTIINGSSADEIITETSTLTFKISGGQSFTLRSADRKILNNDGGLDQNCPSSYSEISITLPSGSGARTIKVTPSSSNCSTLTGGGGGGGGGGSGSSSSSTSSTTPAPTPVPATTAGGIAAQIAAIQAQIAGLLGQTPATGPSTAQFTRNLTVGSQGEDVRTLQQYLNATGFKIAESGPGSPGKETNLFGSLTRVALAKWQAANGISPASGYFGPLTRVKITPVSVLAATPLVAPAATPVSTPQVSGAAYNFTRSLTIGSQGDDVKALQDYLTTTGHYKYSGGSTGRFGAVTKAALAVWQKDNDISPASGYFGPVSKAKYLELINK